LRYNLRFWVENIDPPEIVEKALPLLEEFSAGVCVSTFERSLTGENAGALRALKKAGLQVGLWPLMGMESGYFPNEKNAAEYDGYVRRVIEWADSKAVTPDLLAVDLEMPFDQMTLLLQQGPPRARLERLRGVLRENRDRAKYEGAKSIISELNDWIKARGIKTVVAVLPWVALEIEGDSEVLQDLMETPISGIDWDILSPMWYSSMIAGLTGGLLNERDADWMGYDSCLWLRTRYRERAGVSLGITGTGVLGDERAFPTPEGLMVSVQAALSAGIRDISIYNLEGILESSDPRAWFEALRGARPRVPPRSEKAVDILAALRCAFPKLAPFVKS
jgi:hypothetical protein